MIEIDDFYTDNRVIAGLRTLLHETDDDVSIFALLGISDIKTMEGIKKIGFSIGVHGWSHFNEHKFGYWEMRHLLETADSWQCLDKLIVMPWNRMPRIGALKAMRESAYTLCTPYRWQRIVATTIGCNSIDLKPDILLHPPDLVDTVRLNNAILEINSSIILD